MPHSLSRRAEADLRDIYRYTALTFGARQAQRYLSELSSVFDMLAVYPEAGRKVAEHTRQFIHGRHIIFYRQDQDGVVVGRVLHGARQGAAEGDDT
jgi:toxin ParE1/3/4